MCLSFGMIRIIRVFTLSKFDGIVIGSVTNPIDLILLRHCFQINYITIQTTSATIVMSNSVSRKQLEQLLTLGSLPEQFRQIVVENCRMNRKIAVMQAEMQQRDQVIAQLKQQLDAGIVEHTQQKLAYSRTIENEIENRVREIKQQYIEKNIVFDKRQDELDLVIAQLEQKLKLQTDKAKQLGEKVTGLKLYIMDVVQEKDFLIAELASIVEEQQSKMSECRCKVMGESGDSSNQQNKKKTAVIRRNQ